MKGGARAGAGRPKGKRNKETEARAMLAEQAAAQGITPLEVMLQTMRTAWGAQKSDEAMQAAIAAAPYVHPRLAATEMKLDDKRDRVISDKPRTDDEWERQYGRGVVPAAGAAESTN